MHYYTFYAKDYASKASFLEPMEDLAYRRMLDLYYLNEKPLPSDVEEIAFLIRMRSHCDSIATVLRYFFELTASGYINKKVETVLSEYHEKSSKAKASAEARWAKVKAEKNKNPIKDNSLVGSCGSNANALRIDCESNTNYKPITNNHKQIYIQDKPVKFVFKNELLKVGADEQLVSDWLSVRKVKKSANTKTAFDGFISQLEKSNLDVNTVLKICVDNSWSGFKCSWLANLNMADYVNQQIKTEQQKPIESEWVEF